MLDFPVRSSGRRKNSAFRVACWTSPYYVQAEGRIPGSLSLRLLDFPVRSSGRRKNSDYYFREAFRSACWTSPYGLRSSGRRKNPEGIITSLWPFAPLAFTRLQALPAVPSFTGKCQKTPGWNKKAFLFSDFPVENSKVSKNPGLEQKRARRACGRERPYL